MPGDIDPETINTDSLPCVWSPIQRELTKEEHAYKLDTHSTASIPWSVDVPKVILRLFLLESEIQRLLEPPKDYDPTSHDDCDQKLVTMGFKYPLQLVEIEREQEYLYLEYKIGNSGYWPFEFEPEKVMIVWN
jgi:hypothetical protein